MNKPGQFAAACAVVSLGVAIAGVGSARAQDVRSTVHAMAVREGAELVIPADAPAQTVELNWVVPKDRPAFKNVLNRLGANWTGGVLNLKGLASTVVHPSGNQFQDGKAFVGGKTHLLVLHYNLTGGATLTPAESTFVAPDSATYPLTGSGWFYETRTPSNGYSGWWTFADNGGTGTIDAAYMINVGQLIEDGVIPDKSFGRLVELFGGRKILPGSDGEALTLPRNAAGQVVQTLTVTDARGLTRKIEHAAGAGKSTLVLYPGDTLSVDCGSVAFRAAMPLAADATDDDWSPYLWVAAGDSLSDPMLDPIGGKYYDLLAASRGIRVAVNGKGSSGHWALNESGLCFSQRLRTIPPDADIVTVFGSVNDWKYYQKSVPKGEPTDSMDETESVAAYINETVKVIREKAPLARIVMMTGLYYYGVNQNYAQDSYKLQAEIAKLNPDIRFIDWYEGQNAQGYDFPNADDYEFKQINWETYGNEFGSKYTRDFTTTGGAFGHPSAAFNAEWLGPAFEVELGREIAELRKLEPLPPPADHTHEWKVSVEGDTLTATCQAAGCTVGSTSLSIVGDGFKVADGTPLEVAVEGAENFTADTGATVGEIVYKKGDETLPGAPVEAGAYTANVSVTLDGQTTVLSKALAIHTHRWTVTLDGATFTATCANADGLCATPKVTLTVEGAAKKTADGEPLAVTLVGKDEFEAATGAKVEVVYRKGDVVLDAPPAEVGDYTATVTVALPGVTVPAYEKAISVKEPPARQMAVYLKAGATGAADGTSWDDAYTDAAVALAKAFELNLPLYAAQGVYVIRETVTLPDGFQVYGGFPGEDLSETPDDRDPDLYQTVFTGDQDLDNVWSHAVPNETVVESYSKAIPVTELTDKPLFTDGKFNPPPAYATDYDVYFTQTKGTDTLQCFKTVAGASGILDGLSLVAFGNTTKSQAGSGIYVTKPSGTAMVTVTVRNVKFIGTMSAGGCLATDTSVYLTLDVSGCSFLYIGSFYLNNGACNLVASLKSKGTFRDCRIESVLRKPSNGSAASAAVMAVGQPNTRIAGVDVTGCTFCRCATVSGVNNLYGGTCNILSYGADPIQGTAFCDNTISNCYTAATGEGQIALVWFAHSSGSNSGVNNSGTYRGLRFENNLSLVKTEANACYTMVGTPYGADYAARFSLSDSVFRRNRIHAYGTTAAAGDTVALAIAGSNSTAPAMFTMVNCVFDGNAATFDAASHAGINAISCRGVADAQYPGEAPAATACMGLANCTFVGAKERGVYDVIQTGVHSNDCTLVNCLFNDMLGYGEPCWFSTPSTVKAYSCSTNEISVDEAYRPTTWAVKALGSATVVTNKAAVYSVSNPASNYPVTYSFTPDGEDTALPLCPALTAAAGNIGTIGDLYGDPRRRKNIRGAVQKSHFGTLIIVR